MTMLPALATLPLGRIGKDGLACGHRISAESSFAPVVRAAVISIVRVPDAAQNR